MPRAVKQKSIAAEPVAIVHSNRALPVIVVLVFLLLISFGVAGYFYYQYKHAVPAAESDEIANLTKTIGDVLELPTGETPTLATVTDREKLAEQPFFQRAENGDKVLIYTNSGRAILYRPSTKKIVDVTTVNVNQGVANSQQPTQTSAPATETTPIAPVSEQSTSEATSEVTHVTVALYNGSTKVGVTNTLESDIKAAFADTEVVAKEKAAKNDYQGNLVIDLSGKHADLAKSIAESLGGMVGTLPEGEANPGTDILVIVGNK